MTTSVLEVTDLVTSAVGRHGSVRLLDRLDLSVARGEFVALVGESGSGKSMLCLSIAGLLPPGVAIEAGQVLLEGRNLVALRRSQLRRVRGRELSMVFQDPLSSLNPTMRVGPQIAEPLLIHKLASRAEASRRVDEVLDLVGFDNPRQVARRYPHELSGGMRQRVAIATALACVPKVLIADEPTTALDATVQLQVLRLLKEIQSALNLAIVFVSHDLRVVSRVADRLVVMYAGREAESGPAQAVTAHPRHRYTQDLLGATPNVAIALGGRIRPIAGGMAEPSHMPSGCRFHPRCRFASTQCWAEQPPLEGVSGHRWACWHPTDGVTVVAPPEPTSPFRGTEEISAQAQPLLRAERVSRVFQIDAGGILRRRHAEVVAVDDLSLQIERGETLGLVGESGSGKSTLGRIVVALERLDGGTVNFNGRDIFGLAREDLRSARREFQMMFQDSYSSLDRRMRIEQLVEEPLVIHSIGSSRERKQAVAAMLERLSLPASAAQRLPSELSGGQRQRVGLARALMLNPRLIVADEPVSSLDVSVQATILNLMRDLQAEHRLSYLFISHDLAVVRYMADRIAVMYHGRIVELGDAVSVYAAPLHPYTKELLGAVEGDMSSGRNGATQGHASGVAESRIGCMYRARCPFADERCVHETPKLTPVGTRHAVACHHPLRASDASISATETMASTPAGIQWRC